MPLMKTLHPQQPCSCKRWASLAPPGTAPRSQQDVGPHPGSPLGPQRTSDLAEPLSSFTFPTTPQPCWVSPMKRAGQGPLCQHSQDSLGTSWIRLRNAPFPGGCHRELFFPSCSTKAAAEGYIPGKKQQTFLLPSFCPALSFPCRSKCQFQLQIKAIRGRISPHDPLIPLYTPSVPSNYCLSSQQALLSDLLLPSITSADPHITVQYLI